MQDEYDAPEVRHLSRRTRVADSLGAVAVAAAFAVSVGLGQPAHARAASAGTAPYPARAAGRVIAWPYRDGYAHLCHASQLGAFAVFVTDHGRRAFVARCVKITDGSGRDAWNTVQS